MRRLWLARLAAVCVATLAWGDLRANTDPQPPLVTSQLDRYLRGDFDVVAHDLSQLDKLDDVLEQLRRDGPAWVAAGGPAERSRRVLSAATFALEAGRAGAFHEWKWVQSYMGSLSIYWKTPPLLIEWGCALLRNEPTAHPQERTWQLAAVAASQLAGDHEFLIGSPFQARGNPQDEIEHLKHVTARFPKEPRFALAQAIAVEWTTYPTPSRALKRRPARTADAARAFDGMTRDESIGAEATLRLGIVRLRSGNAAGALDLFEKVEDTTRDPFLVYLARFSTGQAHESLNRPAQAEAAYRGALKVIPNAQSAAIALAALLFRTNRPAEAAEITERAVSAQPPVIDPWREYGAADNRFWPTLITRLREAIAR